MWKFNFWLNVIYAFFALTFLITIVFVANYALKDDYYVYVNNNNKEEIFDLLEEDGISVADDMEDIDTLKLSGYGNNWSIYISRIDGSFQSYDSEHLEDYIRKYGIIGGKAGRIFRYISFISGVLFFLLSIYKFLRLLIVDTGY